MRLAVYSTIYPGAEAFWPEWHESILAQSDRDFRLWVGLDNVTQEDVSRVLGKRPAATWIAGQLNDTPAQIRQRAMDQMVETCDGIVFIDSDDVLLPSRISSARTSLEDADISACALRVINEHSEDLKSAFTLPVEIDLESVLPRNNIFGLSNSAYRSATLRRCLPIPEQSVLIDWFLATRAWLSGATFSFDRTPRMLYRQHSANTARTTLPFDAKRVATDTELVRKHFQLLTAAIPVNADSARRASVIAVKEDVERFYREIVLQPASLARYVVELNALKPSVIWWTSVAYPSLNKMWSPQEL